MSGLLRPKWLPITELLVGFCAVSSYGLVETTTPPETGVGPEGMLPERWLPVSSMPLAPRSAMPIPENASLPCSRPAGHFLVLFSTVLPFTSKSPTGWDEKASKNMPAQLSWIVFPAKEPRWALATQMPHGPPEMRLPTTLASLLARSGPKMTMPVLPERLTSLERILVPGESSTYTPTTSLRRVVLENIFVPGESKTAMPKTLFFLTTLFTILVRELESTTMPSAVSGLPITWLFAIVVLTLPLATIPLATLPVIRFPTTVALRAPVTSIAKS